MPSTNTKPNQYNSEDVVSTSDAAGKVVHDFQFDAQHVAVFNDKATDVYVSFSSTSGSTGGHKVKAGEQQAYSGIRAGLFTLASTSTSTGDKVRVLALGW